jgi:hypothetical protein
VAARGGKVTKKHGNTPYDAACVKCRRVRGTKPYYACRVKKCGTWVAGCRMCFDAAADAKKAVRASVNRAGCGCFMCEIGNALGGLGGLLR